MKSLSVATAIEKNRLSSETPFLPMLDVHVVDPETSAVVEIMRLVRNTEDVVYMGDIYKAAAFDIQLNQESGTLGTVTLTITDYTKAVQARMQKYGGGVGFKVTISVVNAGALDQPAEAVEYFDVTGASASDYVCSWTLGAENALARVFPRRRQTRDFCQWRYRDGNTCGYTGDMPTCDLTLKGPNGCRAHGNSVNFGGAPGINARDTRYG